MAGSVATNRPPPWPRRARMAWVGPLAGTPHELPCLLPLAPWREVWVGPGSNNDVVGEADIVLGEWNGELVVIGWRPLDPDAWPRPWPEHTDGPEQRN